MAGTSFIRGTVFSMGDTVMPKNDHTQLRLVKCSQLTMLNDAIPVSYTHLTLPTNREV